MKKLAHKITAPILLIIVVIVGLFYILGSNPKPTNTIDNGQPGSSVNATPTVKNPNSQNELVEIYITLMQQEQYSKMQELWPDAIVGTTEPDPKADSNATDNLNQTQKKIDYTFIYKYHHDSVISFFGDNAWEKVKYESTKVTAPDGKAKWIEKSTGKEITFEESVKLNEQYWSSILKENNWSEKDVFAPEGGEETPEEVTQREENYAKYIDGEPTEYIVEESYERYAVQFFFNGKEAAESGEFQFKITISNKDGKWVLHDMLTWNPPITEPTSEV